MMSRRFVILLLVSSLSLAGCYTTAMIHPEDLHHLDGYTVGDVMMVPTSEGELYTFHAGTIILMWLSDTRVIKAWYREIQVDGHTFRGTDGHGAVTEIDIRQIRAFYVTTKNKPLTIAVPVVLGTLGVVALIIISWLIRTSCD